MKRYLYCLLLMTLSCLQLFSQEFSGYVKKVDSTSAPVYQAKVEVYNGFSLVQSLKTYFDGSFKFPTSKNLSYLIRVSYTGYVDTVFTISTDKDANPNPSSITVRLKKDGMRFVGQVKGLRDNFPIKGATVVLKNIMTQKEERFTTGVDGQYNLKLEYETNYRVSIDKRSKGTINKYQDTAFYVSTIGFDMPVDYKMDIILGRATTLIEPDDDYDPNRQAANRRTKPAVAVVGSAGNSLNISQRTIPPPANNKPVIPQGQNIVMVTKEKMDTVQTAANGTKAIVTVSTKPDSAIVAAAPKARAPVVKRQPTPSHAANAPVTPAATTANKPTTEATAKTTAAKPVDTVAAKPVQPATPVTVVSAAATPKLAGWQKKQLAEERKLFVEDSIAYVKAKNERVSVEKNNAATDAKPAAPNKPSTAPAVPATVVTKPTAAPDKEIKSEKPAEKKKDTATVTEKEKPVKEEKAKKEPVAEKQKPSKTKEKEQPAVQETPVKAEKEKPVKKEEPVQVKKQSAKEEKVEVKERVTKAAKSEKTKIAEPIATASTIKPQFAEANGRYTPTINMRAVHFDKNTGKIKGSEAKQLKDIAKTLTTASAWKLNLYALASQDEKDPNGISLARALAVTEYLTKAGVPADKVSPYYYGSGISLVDCIGDCGEAIQAQNRCVVYELVKN